MNALTTGDHFLPSLPANRDQRRADLATAADYVAKAISLTSTALATVPAGTPDLDSLNSCVSYLNSSHRMLNRMGSIEA